MVIRGRVKDGVIVVDDASPLPEGAEVSVSYPVEPAKGSGKMSEEQHQHLLDELERLRNLPNENPGDDFDAADMDSVDVH